MAEPENQPVSDKEQTPPENGKKQPFVWRGNVLILVGIGYLTVFFIFVGMIWKGCAAADSYDTISAALMALIGGSLALAKDLVH